MAEKDTLAKDFDNLQDKITTLFRPIYDKLDEFFLELIGKFQKAGVDFLEINNFKKTAIAKHSNYYEYPERRYAIVVDDKNKVKFYELEFKSQDIDNHAKEVSQQEFEQMTIPTYLKPNPLLSKKDSEEDKDPKPLDAEGTKEKKDKDALSQEKPEEKKLLNYGDTSSPKVKESIDRDIEASVHEAINQVLKEVAPPGWEGTVKAMKKHKEITNPWALSWYMKNKGMKSHKKEEVYEGKTTDQAATEQDAIAKLKERGVAFDDSFRDQSSVYHVYFFNKEKIVAKWDSVMKTLDSYSADVKAEATDKPIIDPTDTQGYTGNEGNMGPLEGKKEEAKLKGTFTVVYTEVTNQGYDDQTDTFDNEQEALADYEKKLIDFKKEAAETDDDISLVVKKDGKTIKGMINGVDGLEPLGSKDEGYPAIQQPAFPDQNEAKQYKVKFVNKEGKEDSVILEAKNVKEAATKAYKFGAQSIVSADKYEKRQRTKRSK